MYFVTAAECYLIIDLPKDGMREQKRAKHRFPLVIMAKAEGYGSPAKRVNICDSEELGDHPRLLPLP